MTRFEWGLEAASKRSNMLRFGAVFCMSMPGYLAQGLGKKLRIEFVS